MNKSFCSPYQARAADFAFAFLLFFAKEKDIQTDAFALTVTGMCIFPLSPSAYDLPLSEHGYFHAQFPPLQKAQKS